MQERSSWWVVAGLDLFLRHPRLWWRPLFGSALLLLGLILAWALVIWGLWPDDLRGWDLFWAITAILGLILVVGLVWYLVVLPLTMGLFYEGLSASVMRRSGVHDLPGEGVVAGLRSALVFFVRTMHVRLAWLLIGILSLFLGPLALIVGAIGASHVAILDGLDVALACRGLAADERLAMMRRYRSEIWLNVFVAAGLSILLGMTLIGWLLFTPVVMTATAIAVARWPMAEEVE